MGKRTNVHILYQRKLETTPRLHIRETTEFESNQKGLNAMIGYLISSNTVQKEEERDIVGRVSFLLNMGSSCETEVISPQIRKIIAAVHKNEISSRFAQEILLVFIASSGKQRDKEMLENLLWFDDSVISDPVRKQIEKTLAQLRAKKKKDVNALLRQKEDLLNHIVNFSRSF